MVGEGCFGCVYRGVLWLSFRGRTKRDPSRPPLSWHATGRRSKHAWRRSDGGRPIRHRRGRPNMWVPLPVAPTKVPGFQLLWLYNLVAGAIVVFGVQVEGRIIGLKSLL